MYYLHLAVSDKILGKGTVEVGILFQNNQSRVIRLISALYMPSVNSEGIISTKQCIAKQEAKVWLDTKDFHDY